MVGVQLESFHLEDVDVIHISSPTSSYPFHQVYKINSYFSSGQMYVSSASQVPSFHLEEVDVTHVGSLHRFTYLRHQVYKMNSYYSSGQMYVFSASQVESSLPKRTSTSPT